MRPLNKLLLLLLIVAGGFPAASRAQTVGNCDLGTQAQDLDINNVRARLYNKGNLFFDGGDPNYEIPAGSGLTSIFAGGIWIGGTVNGNIRTAAATYAQGGENYEFYPGPLNEDGSLPNPNDCSQYDKMWKVSRVDIASYIATGNAAPDLDSWPVGLGAPTCVDVDESGTCGPSEPAVEVTSRDQVIDLGAGQLPDIEGDQGVWWVMNDVGGPHLTTLSPPIGLEVQVLAFAFARADALGDATFYKYKFIYRGSQPLENTFLTIWSDPDLGNYLDDYIGSDPPLGLGFVYNADNDDETGAGYGTPPPALGYDFFLGPLVNANGLDDDGDGDIDEDDERLDMTRFGYYNNTADPRTGNPETDQDYYNYMRGLWRDGTPWTEGGDGTSTTGSPVNFIYPNSGTTDMPKPGYWSEPCSQPGCTAFIPPDDRRFTMATGPFTLNNGEVQEVVYGIVWAQGADNFSSLQAMKAADELAQRAFDLDFSLAPPPPAPNVEAAELAGRAALLWSYAPSSSNYLASYDEPDPLITGLFGVEDSTYTFEGFNVYRYADADFNDANRTLVATYDVINEYTTIIDTTFSPEVGGFVPFVAARGTNSGVQFYHIIDDQSLTSYTDYYYGVSAYAYNEESTPDVLESPASKITIRPENLTPGSIANADLGGTLEGERTSGGGTASATATVVDPTAVTGDTYEVRIIEVDDDGETFLTYRIVNTTTGEVELDGVEIFEEEGIRLQPNEGRTVIVDGIAFFITVEATVPEEDQPNPDTGMVDADFAGDGRGIIEVANPNTDPCAGSAADSGCEDYGGNTVWLDPNATGDYLITATAQNRGFTGLAPYIAQAAPEDYEMRFTDACATFGACLGFYDLNGDVITSVPFELWNVGITPDDPSDDVRLIPIIRPSPTSAAPVSDWEDTFDDSQVLDLDGDGTPETTVPISHQVYWMVPDRPNGYDLFEDDANNLFGGPGGVYVQADDNDEQIDINPSTGNPCGPQGAYIDYCWEGTSATLGYPIGRMFVGDVAMDGTTPEPGVTVRFLTVPNPLFTDGDVFVFDTAELGFVADDPTAAAEALEMIGAVPNPYRGFSRYETGNLDRRIRFVNLPDEATIRIFTLSGTLVRTIQANNTRSIDWNIETEEGLPVASGMYLVHVETNIGDKVIKLGIVNRQTRFDAF